MAKTEIFSMMGKKYFVIRNKSGKMIKSSDLFHTEKIARKKAMEYKKKYKIK